tara:strand:- start:4475 stop:6679 length:2205 start_codon:yes stop_codon:yes gene_type:complete
MPRYDKQPKVWQSIPEKAGKAQGRDKWMGERGYQPVDDRIAAFRNLSGGSGSPPAWMKNVLRDKGLTDLTGLMSVKRFLGRPPPHLNHPKPNAAQGKTTLDLATQVPIHDMTTTMSRSAQNRAWNTGKRTEHAWGEGTLPLGEEQSYLLGDEHPQDIHDYDIYTLPDGNVVVLDKKTGLEAERVTYWPFSAGKQFVQDDPLRQFDQAYSVYDAKQGEFVRPTRDVIERPGGVSGTVDFRHFGVGEDPFKGDLGRPVAENTTFKDQVFIATPKGMFAPNEIDWSRAIQNSENRYETLEALGGMLVKALFDEPMISSPISWTEKEFFAGLMKAEPRDKPLPFTENELWDDEPEVEDVMEEEAPANLREVDPKLLSRTPRPYAPMTDAEREARTKTMDYPILGGEIAPFARGELHDDRKEQRRMIMEMAGAKPGSKDSTPFSFTAKMPGPGFSTSTEFCPEGRKNRHKPGHVCNVCNVAIDKPKEKSGQYGAPTVQDALQRRYDVMMDDPHTWARAMATLIPQYHQSEKQGKQFVRFDNDYPGIDGREGYMRWHDSGDLAGGVPHLSVLTDVARATPNTNHWLPTKEWKTVAAFLKAGGQIPENMVIRLSMPWVGQGSKIPSVFRHPQITTTTVGRSQVDPNYEGYVCPASKAGSGGCIDEECNACWQTDFENVDYEFEGKGGKGSPLTMDDLNPQIQAEYERLNPPIPQEGTGIKLPMSKALLKRLGAIPDWSQPS